MIDGLVPMCEKVAYYAAADCCVVSAVRDGLNRIPYFYKDQHCHPIIRVNPWNVEAMAMHNAVTMHAEDKQARHSRNYNYLRSHDVVAWARSFDKALQLACDDRPAMRFIGLGFGMSYRNIAVTLAETSSGASPPNPIHPLQALATCNLFKSAPARSNQCLV
ncbi:hypothetical protein ACP70R_046502 [Stipagrostis hirtigluma subsp. patula]